MSAENQLLCSSFEDNFFPLGLYKIIIQSKCYRSRKISNFTKCTAWTKELKFYQLNAVFSFADKNQSLCRDFLSVEKLEKCRSSKNASKVDEICYLEILGGNYWEILLRYFHICLKFLKITCIVDQRRKSFSQHRK